MTVVWIRVRMVEKERSGLFSDISRRLKLTGLSADLVVGNKEEGRINDDCRFLSNFRDNNVID